MQSTTLEASYIYNFLACHARGSLHGESLRGLACFEGPASRGGRGAGGGCHISPAGATRHEIWKLWKKINVKKNNKFVRKPEGDFYWPIMFFTMTIPILGKIAFYWRLSPHAWYKNKREICHWVDVKPRKAIKFSYFNPVSVRSPWVGASRCTVRLKSWRTRGVLKIERYMQVRACMVRGNLLLIGSCLCLFRSFSISIAYRRQMSEKGKSFFAFWQNANFSVAFPVCRQRDAQSL